MTTATGWVEKSPHVDEALMRRLDGAALAALLPGGNAVADLRARWADPGAAPVDLTNWPAWADAVRGTEIAAALVGAADALDVDAPNWLGEGMGASRLYGHHYLGWLHPLVQAYAVTGDVRHAQRWAQAMQQWLRERDAVVGQIEGLDVIWYSLGVGGRTLHLLDALRVFAGQAAVDDTLWADLVAWVVAGARWSAAEHDAFRHGNWQLVAVSSLLRVGHLLADLPEAADWRHTGRARLLEHLDADVYADGGHHERAPGYHVLSLDALQNGARIDYAHGHDDIRSHPRFAGMHDWLVDLTTPAGWIPPVNDSPVVCAGDLLLVGWHLLPELPNRNDLVWVAQRTLTPEQISAAAIALDPRTLPLGTGHSASELVAAPCRRSGELVTSRFAVLRSGWGRDDTYGVLNLGPTISHELKSHSHRTVLDVVLCHGSTPLVWEAGGPTSYDDEAYSSWYQAGRAHSGVVPDAGDRVPGEGARTEAIDLGGPAELIRGAAIERADGSRHERTLVAVTAPGAPAYWVLRDRVTPAASGGSWSWRLHALAPWGEVESGVWRSRDPHRPSGLAAIVVGAEPQASSTRGCRVPEDSSSDHDLATLTAPVPLGPRAGLDTVLMVEPGEADHPVAQVRRDGERLTIGLGALRDVLDDAGWTRFDENGTVLAATTWRGLTASTGERP